MTKREKIKGAAAAGGVLLGYFGGFTLLAISGIYSMQMGFANDGPSFIAASQYIFGLGFVAIGLLGIYGGIEAVIEEIDESKYRKPTNSEQKIQNPPSGGSVVKKPGNELHTCRVVCCRCDGGEA